MWPRTKRNVVEARELFKDVGRAVLGLPKEPPTPSLQKRKGGLSCAELHNLFSPSFWNTFLPFVNICCGNFRDFFKLFFALGRHLVEAAFLKDLPCKMLVFWGARRPRNLQKGRPEGGPKI